MRLRRRASVFVPALVLPLALLATLGLVATPRLAAQEPAAETPALTASVETRIAGRRLAIVLPDLAPVAGRALQVTGLLDGTPLPAAELVAGDDGGGRAVFGAIDLAPGHHVVAIAVDGAAAEVDFRVIPGWLSILPPLVAIGLALAFRDVLVALLVGIFGGALILAEWNPLVAFARTIDGYIVPAVADGDHAAILVFTTLLGGMVGAITKSGGTHGIIRRLAPFATDSRRGQVATWLMGVAVFFDDYANTLIVGPTMRPITDRLRISREKLAYLVDSTAAPVVCLFPISTWVGFELGLIGDAFEKAGIPYESYSAFLSSVPYRFYPILALVAVLAIALTRVDLGPMRAAEERAARTGALLPPGARPIAEYGSDATEPPADIPKRARNALLPILTVVAVTLLGLYVTGAAGKTRTADLSTVEWLRDVFGDANSFHALLWASLAGVLVAVLLPLAQRLLKLAEALGAVVEGMKSMLLALVVLTLAWGLSAVCDGLQTADYLVALTEGNVAPVWMSTLTFVLAAAIAFATGSSWGTLGILQPLVIPIVHNLSIGAGHAVGSAAYDTFLFSTIASVLAGSVWGDHCSPISDTTILSSMATGCDHIAHVRTQLPYALGVGMLGILVGEIPSAFGLPPWVSLLLGSAVIFGVLMLVARRRRARGELPPEPTVEPGTVRAG